VSARIAQFGRDHPSIRTEYFLEEIDSAGSLFSEWQLARMQGDHPRLERAEPGRRYALLIDVAGESETPLVGHTVDWSSRRDSTAVTIVEVAPPADRSVYGATPIYRVVDRMAWTGRSHVSLHEHIVSMAREIWSASVVVVDATGVGSGLTSFLSASLERRDGRFGPIRVAPFVFTGPSKSQLGWDFLALIDQGRYQEYVDGPATSWERRRLTEAFWAQMRAVTYDVVQGPGKQIRWSVPAGRGHDDLVMSAALAAVLDDFDLTPRVARGMKGRTHD
jgi:hypothetical protein